MYNLAILLAYVFGVMNIEVAATKKRLVMDEVDYAQELLTLKATITAFLNNLTALERENANLQGKMAAMAKEQGSVYIHWGRTQCPGNNTELVYRGYIAGGHYTDGSGASLDCLPEHPTWNKYDDQHNALRAYIYGAELDAVGSLSSTMIDNHDMPCSVCRAPFSTTHMFPGRAGCYKSWTQQYTGYLVSSYHGRSMDMEYYCIDVTPESVPHGDTDDNQCVLYLVEARCGVLPCPTYVEGREIACTVCSK